MSERNTLVRSLHDIGLAAWFGGSLMGAVGVNGAAHDVTDPHQRLRVASAGWARWSPINAVAIGAHLVGGLGIISANRNRARYQAGVGSSTMVKTVLTGAALVATAYSGYLGRKLAAAEGVPVEGGAVPASDTPPEVGAHQQQLRLCQWAIPALTGGIEVLNALHGEQQRPTQQLANTLRSTAQRVGATT